jgi:hypothetical protein
MYSRAILFIINRSFEKLSITKEALTLLAIHTVITKNTSESTFYIIDAQVSELASSMQ